MRKKYEFTGETLLWQGQTLQRIRRISDGALGGFIQHEKNLSHYGTSWISLTSKVWDDAQVLDNASVHGNVQVRDNAIISDLSLIHI